MIRINLSMVFAHRSYLFSPFDEYFKRIIYRVISACFENTTVFDTNDTTIAPLCYNLGDKVENIVVLNSAPLQQHALNTTFKKHYTTFVINLGRGTTNMKYFGLFKKQIPALFRTSKPIFPYYIHINDNIISK